MSRTLLNRCWQGVTVALLCALIALDLLWAHQATYASGAGQPLPTPVPTPTIVTPGVQGDGHE